MCSRWGSLWSTLLYSKSRVKSGVTAVVTYIPGVGAGLRDRVGVDGDGEAPVFRPLGGWGGGVTAGWGEQGVAAQLWP